MIMNYSVLVFSETGELCIKIYITVVFRTQPKIKKLNVKLDTATKHTVNEVHG